MKKLYLVALALSFFSAQAQAVPARTDRLPVSRCVNMGNALEPPTENGWGGKLITKSDFQIIAKAGFDTVRIPIRWSAHAGTIPPYPVNRTFMARVVEVVGWARKAGLNVIINDHHYEALAEAPEAHKQRLAGIWDQVAAQFADQSRDHLWFEISNEPHKNITRANLLATFAPALAAIRRTNPNRPVLLGADSWSSLTAMETMPFFDDPHIIPTFHYYDPFEFTHQGASWLDNPSAKRRTFGSAKDRAALARDASRVKAYIKKTGKTPLLGEFGAIETIAVAERVKYQKAVRQAFETTGIGMCAWSFTNTFPLYDHRKGAWIPGMLDAMGVRPRR